MPRRGSSGGRWACTEGQPDGEGRARTLRAVAAMVPPCSSTSSLTRASPIPLPSLDRARARLDPVEALEQPRHLGGGHADAGVRDGHDRLAVPAVDPDRDGAVEGELQRVGEQVEHHLLPHVAVDVDRLVQRRSSRRRGRGRPGRRPTGRRWPVRRSPPRRSTGS